MGKPTRMAMRLGLGVSAVAWSHAAATQTVPVPLPPPVDLTRPQAPIRAPEPMLKLAQPTDEGVPVAIDGVTVTLNAVDVAGVTAYPPGAFDELFAPMIGKQVALADLFRAAARIEARYRRDGYFLSRAVVPAQEAVAGRYRIQVVEGYVSAVELTGDVGRNATLLHAYLDRATEGRPARIGAMERALLLANDVPGITAHAVLTPDAGATGAARLVVEVRRAPVNAFVTLNNRGSRFAGPLTGTIGVDLNGIGGAGGHIGGLYFTTFDHEQNYGELAVDAHVGRGGLKLRGWGSYASSRPGSILAPLGIHSRSFVGGVGADYPLLRTRAASLWLHGSFEITDDRTNLLGTPNSLDRQRILRFGVSAQAQDGWRGSDAFSLTLHKGLDILDASHDGDTVAQSRLGGHSDFFKLTATASRYQPLHGAPWGGIGLQVSAAGQYAANRLLSLEQFHVGGESLGRGFNPSQYSGDQGAGVDAELQVTRARPIGPLTGQQAYVFFDAAFVRDRGISRWRPIRSAGGGVRADIGPRLSGQVELAVPYEGGRQIGARLDHGAQVFFRLTARY